MSLILHIDTSLESASVALSIEKKCLALLLNDNQQDHAAWIHLAIRELFQQAGHTMQELSAVAVTIGPGSYTGLRVGLATAKGICYAVNKPLITIPTLQLLASVIKTTEANKDVLLCPMIDARRMEVYTATYDTSLKELAPAHALVLDENSFEKQLNNGKVFFCGNGAGKFRGICNHPHAHFEEEIATAAHMISLAWQRFEAKQFADLAYCDPLYVKEFQSTVSNR